MTAQGLRPAVAEAAKRAGVSRATAYRHFPTRDFLVVEMALPIPELREALGQAGRMDPVRRIPAMVRTIGNWCFDHELVLREMLRASLMSEADGQGYQRPTTRLGLIAHELEPLRSLLSASDYRRLSMALALLIGIEPLIVLKDLGHMNREEAIDTLVWTATQVTRSAIGRRKS